MTRTALFIAAFLLLASTAAGQGPTPPAVPTVQVGPYPPGAKAGEVVLALKENVSRDFLATLTPPVPPAAPGYEFVPVWSWTCSTTKTWSGASSASGGAKAGFSAPAVKPTLTANQNLTKLTIHFTEPGIYEVAVTVTVSFKTQGQNYYAAPPQAPAPVFASAVFVARAIKITILEPLNDKLELVQDHKAYKETIVAQCEPDCAVIWDVTGKFSAIVGADFKQQRSKSGEAANKFYLKKKGDAADTWNTWQEDAVVSVSATAKANPKVKGQAPVALVKFRRATKTALGSDPVKLEVGLDDAKNPEAAVLNWSYKLGAVQYSGLLDEGCKASLDAYGALSEFEFAIEYMSNWNGEVTKKASHEVSIITSKRGIQTRRAVGVVSVAWQYNPKNVKGKKDAGDGAFAYNGTAFFKGGAGIYAEDKTTFFPNWAAIRLACGVVGAVDGKRVTMVPRDPLGLNYVRGTVAGWTLSVGISTSGPTFSILIPVVNTTERKFGDGVNGTGGGPIAEKMGNQAGQPVQFSHNLFLGQEAYIEQAKWADYILLSSANIGVQLFGAREKEPQLFVFAPSF